MTTPDLFPTVAAQPTPLEAARKRFEAARAQLEREENADDMTGLPLHETLKELRDAERVLFNLEYQAIVEAREIRRMRQ